LAGATNGGAAAPEAAPAAERSSRASRLVEAGKAIGLPAQSVGSVLRGAKTYARTGLTMLADAVAVKPSSPALRELPRHPRFPVTSGVDSFGAVINATGGVLVENTGSQERPTVSIRGEYDWLLLRDGASQRRITPPWTYGEMFDRLCA